MPSRPGRRPAAGLLQLGETDLHAATLHFAAWQGRRREADRRQPPRAARLPAARPVRGGHRADRHRGEGAARRHARRCAGLRGRARRRGLARRPADPRVRRRATARTTSPTGRASCCCTAARSTGSYGKVREKGLTIVPTRLYFKDGRVKIELALARGKEKRDKRRDDRRARREAADRPGELKSRAARRRRYGRKLAATRHRTKEATVRTSRSRSTASRTSSSSSRASCSSTSCATGSG